MIEQYMIAGTGVTAIFLSQSVNAEYRRYACLFGLAGQPFWMYAAYTADQWGILVLTLFYTMAWMKGVKTHWIQEQTK